MGNAVVTGGARGIGLATTALLVERGFRVHVLDREPPAADEAALPRGAHLHGVDLLDVGAIPDVVAATLDDEPLEILVNNAAVYPRAGLAATSDLDIENAFRVNVAAAFALTRECLPNLRRGRVPSIVFVSSIATAGDLADLHGYVASKAAVEGLTRSLARELGPLGITVNCVAPGAIPTAAEGPRSESLDAEILARQAIKRRGTVTDVADAIAYLAVGQRGFVTGQTLRVSGGWVMDG